jgi:hypothetical protein
VSDQLIGLLIAARAARPRPFGYITRWPHATSPTPRPACRSRSKLLIQNYRRKKDSSQELFGLAIIHTTD